MNTTIKCVILDDELLAISYLKLLCSEIEDIEVVKVFNDPKQFLLEKDDLDYDVCILDIEMQDYNGLQIAEKLDHKLVIFTTAYKEYAAEAFDINAVDYIRKPIKKERLENSFNKVREKLSIEERQIPIEWTSNFGKTIIYANQINYIKTSEIDSRDKEIYLTDHSCIILKNLNYKNLLNILPEKAFVQINKKEIIAIKAIKLFAGHDIITKVFLDNQFLKLNVSDVYRKNLIEKLG